MQEVVTAAAATGFQRPLKGHAGTLAGVRSTERLSCILFCDLLCVDCSWLWPQCESACPQQHIRTTGGAAEAD